MGEGSADHFKNARMGWGAKFSNSPPLVPHNTQSSQISAVVVYSNNGSHESVKVALDSHKASDLPAMTLAARLEQRAKAGGNTPNHTFDGLIGEQRQWTVLKAKQGQALNSEDCAIPEAGEELIDLEHQYGVAKRGTTAPHECIQHTCNL